MVPSVRLRALTCVVASLIVGSVASAEDVVPKTPPSGDEPGWVALGETDFADVNGEPETWTFHEGGLIKTTGKPVGVLRTVEKFGDVEILVEWRHLEAGGNSGIFAWVNDEALNGLKPDQLPNGGIEIQMLDHGYAEKYEKSSGKKGDWFTTNGDIFAVGASTMKPFPPLSPNGSRSFPKKELSKGVGEWNRYYVRCIGGTVRLYVNGEEVSGGSDCEPAAGYLCLEAEGAPVEFRGLKVRRPE